ncbi:MAG: efflux RND transporter periplasmic adaptor subunit [Pseudomonadota bacterium]
MSTIKQKTRKLLEATALTSVGAAALIGFNAFHVAAEAQPETAASVAAAPAVTVAHPVVKEIVEWDQYTGRFEAMDNVEVRARVSGYLTDVAFEDGQVVKKGDLLFRIDARPFEAALAAAKADLAGADAGVKNARAEYARGKQLVKRQVISQEAVDNRLRALRQAEAGYAAASARVTEAELNLEFTEVRAPITGRISDDFVSEGNLIIGGAQGGTLLTTLVSQSPIYFEFTASEANYLKYLRLDRDGSRVSGRNAAHPVRVKLMDEDSFDHAGSLSFVDNRIDRSTGTMRGRATLDNSDGFFAPGMFGQLQLLGSGEYDAVLIPDSAIQTDQSEKFVWVSDDNNVVHRQRVTLGPIVDGLRVIRTGLSGDHRVVINGTQFVASGVTVQPNVEELKTQEPAPQIALAS